MAEIFEVKDGLIIARLPHAADGTLRVADGRTFLNVEQAAQAYGMSADKVRKFYTYAMDESPETSRVRAVMAHDQFLDPGDVLLRRQFYYLPDELFRQYVVRCRLAGFTPWSADLHPRQELDDSGEERKLVIVAGINHYRRVAARDPRYRGPGGTFFCGEDGIWRDFWDDPKTPPRAARSYIMVADKDRDPFATVTFQDCIANAGDEVSNQRSWKEKPSQRMGAASQVAVLRQTCGDGFGGEVRWEGERKLTEPKQMAIA